MAVKITFSPEGFHALKRGYFTALHTGAATLLIKPLEHPEGLYASTDKVRALIESLSNQMSLPATTTSPAEDEALARLEDTDNCYLADGAYEGRAATFIVHKIPEAHTGNILAILVTDDTIFSKVKIHGMRV